MTKLFEPSKLRKALYKSEPQRPLEALISLVSSPLPTRMLAQRSPAKPTKSWLRDRVVVGRFRKMVAPGFFQLRYDVIENKRTTLPRGRM